MDQTLKSLFDVPGAIDKIIQGKWNKSQVDIKIPKIDFNANFDLKENLQEMGMNIAFKPEAEFEPMTATHMCTNIWYTHT